MAIAPTPWEQHVNPYERAAHIDVPANVAEPVNCAELLGGSACVGILSNKATTIFLKLKLDTDFVKHNIRANVIYNLNIAEISMNPLPTGNSIELNIYG